jgi:hypothetical protein
MTGESGACYIRCLDFPEESDGTELLSVLDEKHNTPQKTTW